MSEDLLRLHTRFLYPMMFDWRMRDDVLSSLRALRLGEMPVWREANELSTQYLDNTVPFVRSNLFDASTPDGGRYLKATEAITELLSQCVVRVSERDLHIDVAPDYGIELFMSGYGSALLSFTLSPRERLTWKDARQFNSALHLGPEWDRTGRCMHFFVTDEKRDHWEALGIQAASVTLPELMHRVVPGLTDAVGGEQVLYPLQRSFGVFTVAQCSDDVAFDSPDTRCRLEPELAALQGIWPSSHAGAVANETTIYKLLLNRRHWLAVGHQGAAHIVADQAACEGAEALAYNEERVRSVLTKGFMNYFTVLMQRLSLQRLSTEAMEVLCSTRDFQAVRESIASLRIGLLHFSVQSQPFQLSNEDVASKIYRLTVDALGVEKEWQHLRQVFEELDSHRNAHAQESESQRQTKLTRQMEASLRFVAGIQDKVEWVEAVIISIYAVELGHVLGHAFGLSAEHAVLPWWYPGVSLLVLACGTLGIAVWALELLTHSEEADQVDENMTTDQEGMSSRTRRIVALGGGLVLLIAHLVTGWVVADHDIEPTHHDMSTPTTNASSEGTHSNVQPGHGNSTSESSRSTDSESSVASGEGAHSSNSPATDR